MTRRERRNDWFDIAVAESCLPGETTSERLGFAAEHRVGIEIEFDGSQSAEPYLSSGVAAASVQCWRLRDVYPLHPDPDVRKAAIGAVFEALDFARAVRAPRLVTVCDYGLQEPGLSRDDALERAATVYLEMAARARGTGVRILIENLSPRRCWHFLSPEGVIELLRYLDRPETFGLVVDTGHLSDWLTYMANERPALGTIEDQLLHLAWPVDELQLRGPESGFPDPSWPIESWAIHLAENNDTRLISLEHRQPADPAATRLWIERLREVDPRRDS